MSAWVGDDGRILEPGPFDQDREPPEKPLAEWERDSHDHPDDYAPDEPGSADVPIPATTEAEEWTMMPPGGLRRVASMADIERLESKLDLLLERLAGPMPAPQPVTAAEILADPRVISDPKVYEAFVSSPEVAEAAALTPTQDRERAKEIASSARVEAAKAEMEARAAMAAMDPAEAVAQGLGISQPRPGPEDVEDGRSFRDQPAEPDDPFAGLGG